MPRLIERLRGKSGDDLLNEVNSAFDTDRRMFFERPAWSDRNTAFPRGFPFSDEEDEPPRRARWNEPRGRRFGAFSGDRAASFAEPEWDEELKHKIPKSPPKTEEPQPSTARPLQGLNQHGLRNTVPIVQPQEATAKESVRSRAMSAPPGDRPQRFVSSCEIPLQQPQQQQQQQTGPQPQGNVRVIPIQVEGRDEPLVNTNIDTSSNFAADNPPSFDGRLPRDFGPYRKHSSRFGAPHSPPPFGPPHSPPPQKQAPRQQPQQQQQAPPPRQQPQQQQAPPPRQQPQQQQQAQQQQSKDEVDRAPAPPADPAAVSLARVADVQREVDQLASQVEAAKPTSRKDKEYMYLDEMLTRELIKLDDIDTAGQDNVRQARKDAIRSIQKCISVLESKVPGEPMDVVAESEEAEEPMVQGAEEPVKSEPEEQQPVEGQVAPTGETSDTPAPCDPPA